MSVTLEAPHSFSVRLYEEGNRAVLFCELDGHSYHVWATVSPNASSIESAELNVYKRCHPGLVRGDAGWHQMRVLDGTRGLAKVAREAMMLAGPELVAAARGNEAAEREQLAAKHAELTRTEAAREAAPELLVALREALDAVRIGPPETIGYSSSEKSVFDAGWNAALNTVYARHEDARALVERLEAGTPAGAAVPA